MPIAKWKELFNDVTPRNFAEKCCLYDRHQQVMYSCGEFPNMMLMGPRGCIAFTPALILGQLKWGVTPVPDQQLGGLYLWYKDEGPSTQEVMAVRKALRDIHLRGQQELGEHQTFYSEEYKSWRAERVKGISAPSFSIPPAKGGLTPTEAILGAKVRMLEYRLQEARDRGEMKDVALEKSDKVASSLKEEIKSLKRDYAEMSARTNQLTMIRQNRAMEDEILSLRRRLDARGEAWRTVSEAERVAVQDLGQARATIRDYQRALDQAHQREAGYKQALEESQAREAHLNDQLKGLIESHDNMQENQAIWEDNWKCNFDECEQEKEQWKGKCHAIIEGFGDFADKWLVTFEEAQQEFHMYPDTEIRPAMGALFRDCTRIARRLRRWRTECNGGF
ncbi:unnamed protein product [Lupinus luteus]|uniref:DUF7745 domain-containing protein n=1 Tax=Lupinus luteus TaxID=3873 RepID=A0AAV1WB65_LUPLU